MPETTVPETTVPETTTPETTVPEPTTPETTTPGRPPDDGARRRTPEPTTPPTPEVPEPSEPSSPPAESPTPPQPDQPDELDQPATAEGIDGITRPISFPVLGTVQYANGWGDCRDGCSRRHVGTDMLGVRMQPLLAAVDGTITTIRTDSGISGNGITVTGADGWYYNYFHVNNDTPGTDDGLAAPHWQVSPKLTVGSRVRAGQIIGYMGDSGNAEGSVPHLHFEIRTPDRTPVNPYPSLVAAQERETCEPIERRVDELGARLTVSVRGRGHPARRRWALGDRQRRTPPRRGPGRPRPARSRCELRRRERRSPPKDHDWPPPVAPVAKPAPAVPAPAPRSRPRHRS